MRPAVPLFVARPCAAGLLFLVTSWSAVTPLCSGEAPSVRFPGGEGGEIRALV